MQWVVLGTGEPSYQQALEELAAAYPTKVAVRMAFSDAIAHRIEAGSDMFLMPSRYEPCGLNQLYSLKYGTVPIVHETGGLADTIVDFTGMRLAMERAMDFSSGVSLRGSAGNRTARLEVFTHHPDQWGRLVECGMRQDWSWSRSGSAIREPLRTARRKLRPVRRAGEQESRESSRSGEAKRKPEA
ncbi:MAG: glycosyltransferase [Pirellulaceae bacterium]